jgi:hypothetical protein
MNLVEELHAIAPALRRAGIPYAVCGGVAVTAYGAGGSARDIYIAIRREHVTTTLAVVAPLGYTIPAAPITFAAGTPRERHVRRVSKLEVSRHLVLGLSIAEAAYAGVLDDRVEVVLPSGPIYFVSRATLLRMKRLAGRPADLVDVEQLQASGVHLSAKHVARRLATLATSYAGECIETRVA